jgi:uncharacterized membrane protein YphA (DoxX/SURF4 family)
MINNKIRRSAAIFQSKYPAIFFRLLIGIIFVFSAINKLPMHSQFVAIVESYHLLPHTLATAYAYALPWVELLTGSFLLLGIQIRPSSLISLLLALSFLAANVSSAVSGESFCGSCFGEAIILPISLALALDTTIIIISVYIYIVGKQPYSFDSLFARR